MSWSHRSLAAAIVATTLAIMPMSLVGALSVEIRGEMDFSTTLLGQLVAVYFLSLAIASIPAGHWVVRLTPRRGLVVGGVGSASALLSIALFAREPWHLALCLVLAGVASAVVQPSANTAVADGTSAARLGLIFGVKQSAVPFAGVVAGTMVPLVALPFGWRWAFALCSIGALAVVMLARGIREAAVVDTAAVGTRQDAPNRQLFILSVAFAFGTASAGSLSAFFVEASVASGVSFGRAGIVLSLASAAGVVVRLFVGWLADRRNATQLATMSIMLCTGAGGFILLATGLSEFYVIGALVGFGAGWGWPGLMNLTVVRMWSARPAQSTGVAMSGMAIGATTGPIVFGKIAHDGSFTMMWVAVAGVALFAATMLWWIRRDQERSLLVV